MYIHNSHPHPYSDIKTFTQTQQNHQIKKISNRTITIHIHQLDMERVGEVFCTSPQPFEHQPSIPAENSYSYQFLERENWCESEEEKWSAIDIWEDFLKELDVEGHEMIKNFVSKVEENVPFEQVFREMWHHFRGKPASHMLEKIARKIGREREKGFAMRERGIDLEGELKNERFKVKTMNTPGTGVVKEDEGK